MLRAATTGTVFNRWRGWVVALTTVALCAVTAAGSPTQDARRVPDSVTTYISIEDGGAMFDTVRASAVGDRLHQLAQLTESARWWKEMTEDLGPGSGMLMRQLLKERVTLVERPLSEADERRLEAALKDDELRVQFEGEDTQWLIMARTDRATVRDLMQRIKPRIVRWIDGLPVYAIMDDRLEMTFDGSRLYVTAAAFPDVFNEVVGGKVDAPLSRSLEFRAARASDEGRIMAFLREQGETDPSWEVVFADVTPAGMEIHHRAHTDRAHFTWSGDEDSLDVALLHLVGEDAWLLSVDRVMPIDIDEVDFTGFAAEMLSAVRDAFTPLLDTLNATSFTIMSTDETDGSNLVPTIVWGVEVKDLDAAARETDRLLSGVLVAGRLAMATRGITIDLPDAWPEDAEAERHVDLSPILAAIRDDASDPQAAALWTTDLNLRWFGVRAGDRAWWLIGNDAALLNTTRTRLQSLEPMSPDPDLISVGRVDASHFAGLVSRWCDAVPVDREQDRDIAHAVCAVIESAGDLAWTLRRESEQDVVADVELRWITGDE